MRNPFTSLFSRFAVKACPACESASGSFYNASTGEISQCAACSGSGHEPEVLAAPIVDLAMARIARAKEQRRVA